MLGDWFQRHGQTTTRRRKPPSRAPWKRRSIGFEPLEQRTVLSALSLTCTAPTPVPSEIDQVQVASPALEVEVVNNAPFGTDVSRNIVIGRAYALKVADFGFSDPDDVPTDSFQAVRITTVPQRGSLTLSGATVFAGQVVSVADIQAGQLTFITTTTTTDVPYAQFTFQVQDNGGTVGGGVDLDPTPNTFRFFATDALTNFVRGVYQEVLNREPDAGGLSTWIAILNTGAPNLQVTAGLWESPEHRGLQVDGYYQQFLHRSADAAGRQFWISQMLAGANEVAMMGAFMATIEYQQSQPSNTAFVSAVYLDVLGRTPDSGGQAFWVGELNAGRLNRSQVANGLINTTERHQLLVTAYYQAFFDRTPDSGGFTQWVSQLNNNQITDGRLAEVLLATLEFFNASH